MRIEAVEGGRRGAEGKFKRDSAFVSSGKTVPGTGRNDAVASEEDRLDRERRDGEASEGKRGRGQCGACLLSFLCCR